jgi:uncharacterized protein (TIGR03083 family)
VASQLLPSSVTVAVPGPAFSHREYCARVRGETDVLANLASGSDLAAKVPWSRTWRLADLVHHVGAIHRWAANIIEAEARRYLPVRDTDDWPTEPNSAEAARWLRAGGDRLSSVLEGADPGRKVWAWGIDQHVRFWPRRMTHETGIHRADAELTLGLVPHFGQGVASDGMNEFLENLWRARAWRRSMGALRGEGERIGFNATDTGEGWLVVRHPKGFDWSYRSRGRVPHAEVTVNGPVPHLYLLAWKRIPLDAPQVTISGDRDVLRHWYRYSSV